MMAQISAFWNSETQLTENTTSTRKYPNWSRVMQGGEPVRPGTNNKRWIKVTD